MPHAKPRALTEREQARMGPRSLKVPGSPEWCWQAVEVLKAYHSRVEMQWRDVEKIRADLESVRAWEVIPPEAPYGSLDALVRAELGVSVDELDRRVVAAAASERMRNAAEVTTGAVLPRNRPLWEVDNLSTSPQKERAAISGVGVVTQKKLDRLARDRPDLLARVRSGELSANAASIEAGFVKRQVSVCPDNPDAVSAFLAKHFDAAEIKQIADLAVHIREGRD